MAGSLDGFTTKFQLRSKENSESGVVSPRSLPPRKTINLILSHGIILNWNFERSVRTRDSFFIRGENLYIYNSRWEKICVHKLMESEPHLHIHSFFPPPRFSLSPILWKKNGQTGAVLYLRHLHIPPFQTALPLCSASLNSTSTPNFSFLRRHCTLHTSRYRRLLLVNSLCQNLARLEEREKKEKEERKKRTPIGVFQSFEGITRRNNSMFLEEKERKEENRRIENFFFFVELNARPRFFTSLFIIVSRSGKGCGRHESPATTLKLVHVIRFTTISETRNTLSHSGKSKSRAAREPRGFLLN